MGPLLETLLNETGPIFDGGTHVAAVNVIKWLVISQSASTSSTSNRTFDGTLETLEKIHKDGVERSPAWLDGTQIIA